MCWETIAVYYIQTNVYIIQTNVYIHICISNENSFELSNLAIDHIQCGIFQDCGSLVKFYQGIAEKYCTQDIRMDGRSDICQNKMAALLRNESRLNYNVSTTIQRRQAKSHSRDSFWCPHELLTVKRPCIVFTILSLQISLYLYGLIRHAVCIYNHSIPKKGYFETNWSSKISFTYFGNPFCNLGNLPSSSSGSATVVMFSEQYSRHVVISYEKTAIVLS